MLFNEASWQRYLLWWGNATPQQRKMRTSWEFTPKVLFFDLVAEARNETRLELERRVTLVIPDTVPPEVMDIIGEMSDIPPSK
eukprot:TRINITY_DN3005_c0_g1_i1.p1 TRINITY_DN3005_c0_g1~~TRINITY_DN3005_c0_g1_i1.p1  ORF type:complete len:83 (-),score=18.97 TRINITY_DN3005_c0_g1_i1:106-354(-)